VAGRLVILDRDGVVNHDSQDFIKSPDEWLPIAGSIEAIAALSSAGFTVAVATNQSGIGRKLIDPPSLEAIHRKFRQQVRELGGDLDRIVYCPHLPADNCDCRKPAPGLLLKLARHYGAPLNGVPIIGDSERDILAARAAGGRPILVLTGNGAEADSAFRARKETVETYASLSSAAEKLIDEQRARAHRP
jgi:D-glycero-D-manno-heptose 1,7-bisphosphate phosphatase